MAEHRLQTDENMIKLNGVVVIVEKLFTIIISFRFMFLSQFGISVRSSDAGIVYRHVTSIDRWRAHHCHHHHHHPSYPLQSKIIVIILSLSVSKIS